MRVIILFKLIITMNIFGYTQTSGNITVLDTNVDPAGIIDEFPLAPPKTIGSTYIEDKWIPGLLKLDNNKRLSGYPMRYDLLNNVLEINFDGEIKVCPMERIKSFYLKRNDQMDTLKFINTTYTNQVKRINSKNIKLILLEKQHVILYKEYYLETKKSTYVPALDMGDRNNSIVKKHSYYVVLGDKSFRISSVLKKNSYLFGKKYSRVESYGKCNKLKLKNENDLIQLVEYYETLL